MTTPSGPEPRTGRTLLPAEFTVKKFQNSRVYPEPGAPDDYGQLRSPDKDRSRQSTVPSSDSSLAHYRSDLDSSKQAQHHTLGSGRNQAASGTHQHDGTDSVKMGPMEFDPTPGNEGQLRPALTVAATAASIRTFLHEFFEFRDI